MQHSMVPPTHQVDTPLYTHPSTHPPLLYRLYLCQVDCERTAANQGLAAEEGIRAFPTFHLHREQRRVEEIRWGFVGGCG